MLPFATPKWLVLISSFILGISVDIFSSDIGINACCCVLIGFLRPMYLNLFSGNIDNVAYLRPSMSSLGVKNFVLFTSTMVLTHHILYFIVETFAINELLQLLLRILLSSIVTIVLILLLDMIFFKRHN